MLYPRVQQATLTVYAFVIQTIRKCWLLNSKLTFNHLINYFSPVFSVRCAQDPPLFFTEVLEKALDKSNSKTVTRVLVTRSEVSQGWNASHLQASQIRTERQNNCVAAEFWNVDDFFSTFTLRTNTCTNTSQLSCNLFKENLVCCLTIFTD